MKAAQKYLVDEVQSVYRSQGVEIADKHIEVIVRQMTRKVRVDEPGETIMLPGELLERFYIDGENEKSLVATILKNQLIQLYCLVSPKPVLIQKALSPLPLSKKLLVFLLKQPVEGKKDWLRGLKEKRHYRSIDSCRYRIPRAYSSI